MWLSSLKWKSNDFIDLETGILLIYSAVFDSGMLKWCQVETPFRKRALKVLLKVSGGGESECQFKTREAALEPERAGVVH